MSVLNRRIYLVDDDEAVRDSLAMLLRADGHEVRAYSAAESFLDDWDGTMHGCLILDMKMPGMDGAALQEELLRRGNRMPIIFLSGYATIPMTVRTIRSGAVDFLIKPVDGAELLASVRKALNLSSDASQTIQTQRLSMLTEREREVMRLSIEGRTSKEIAQLLSISYRTVESHRAHILRKTGASNLIELARIAYQGDAI